MSSDSVRRPRRLVPRYYRRGRSGCKKTLCCYSGTGFVAHEHTPPVDGEGSAELSSEERWTTRNRSSDPPKSRLLGFTLRACKRPSSFPDRLPSTSPAAQQPTREDRSFSAPPLPLRLNNLSISFLDSHFALPFPSLSPSPSPFPRTLSHGTLCARTHGHYVPTVAVQRCQCHCQTVVVVGGF